jgi:hypothetical protein
MDEPPGLYVSPDHYRRKLNDAHAGHRCFAQCGHVIGNEARSVWHDRLLTIVMTEPSMMLAIRRAEIEAGDQTLCALIEAAHDEIGRLQRREADADRDVEALGDHTDASVGAFQMHLRASARLPALAAHAR